MDTLRLPSTVHGFPSEEFRFTPVAAPGFGIVERRFLFPANERFPEGESDWIRVSDEEIAQHLEACDPVAEWLTR